MGEDWHTIDTANRKSVPLLFGSQRPKIWLRRCRPEHRPAVREYILNRGTQAEPMALENLKRVMGL